MSGVISDPDTTDFTGNRKQSFLP